MSTVVGIDLGMSNSATAHINAHGKPEIIRSELGRTVTPSAIYFDAGNPIVGDMALKRQRAGQRDVAHLFKPYIADEYFLFSSAGRNYSAVDLSACVLSYLKLQAESFLNDTIAAAVITVPAYFTDPQYKATMKAGEQAGLHVLKIIDEPTAAALAYRLQPGQEKQLILVYDLGGRTFDISLMSITESGSRILGTDGSDRLGGTDWDRRILHHIVQQFESEHAIVLTDDEYKSLYFPVERAKHALSVRQQAAIKVQARDYIATYTITRAQLEELTGDLMEKIHMLTERLLRAVDVRWEDITGVLPVGGATRMPMVRSYIEHVSGKQPMSGHNPDEVVALGAAIQAVREQQSSSQVYESSIMVDAEEVVIRALAKKPDERFKSVEAFAKPLEEAAFPPKIILNSPNLAVQQLGNYRLIRKLGSGGFADVYLGQHRRLNTFAAIKVLHSRMSNNDVKEFEKEAQTIANLRHPSIVRVLDFVVEGNTPFLVMDYAVNGTLRQRHPEGSRLPLNSVVYYVKQMAGALQFAHDQKLIHRDVKPENMLLGPNNEILLSDFGIAAVAHSTRSLQTQGMAGTIYYMAPEQIQGKARPASDQYALAAVAYEWLSGSRPFNGTPWEIVTQHLTAPLPPLREKNPAISPAVEHVLQIALAKDPHQRFASVQAFANALEQASK